MYDQFSNVMKMGSFGSIMSMIPGLSSAMQSGQVDGNQGQKRIESFLVMMDSMTNEELDGEVRE